MPRARFCANRKINEHDYLRKEHPSRVQAQAKAAMRGPSRFLIFLIALAGLGLPAAAQDPECPHFSGDARQRVEQRGRWLVSESLPREVGLRSPEFAHLIRFEQCHVLENHLLDDEDRVRAGPNFAVHNVGFQSRVAHQGGTWMMAIAPMKPSDPMPAANLLELTDRQWTLMYRDKNGHRKRLASGSY